jgi:hypothetical protein
MSRLLDLGPLAWPMFTLHSLVGEAGQRVRKLPDGECPPTDRQFLTQLLGITRAAALHLDAPEKYRNPWQNMVTSPLQEQRDLLNEPQYFFSRDGALAFLLVRPVQAEAPSRSQGKCGRAARIVDGVRPQFDDLEMGVTGLPVLESDEMVASQRVPPWRRGWHWPASRCCTSSSFAAHALPSDRRHPSRRHRLGDGMDDADSGPSEHPVGHVRDDADRPGRLRRAVGDTLRSGAARRVTTRSDARDGRERRPRDSDGGRDDQPGVFATMLADFQAVVELGWIAGCGVLLCALATCTFLPALLTLLDRRRCTAEQGPVVCDIGSYRPWLPGLANRPQRVVAGGLLLTALAGCWRILGPL